MCAAGAPPLCAWRRVLTQHACGRSASLPATALRHGLSGAWLLETATVVGLSAGFSRPGSGVGDAMRRSKAEVERYIASVQGFAPSPREVSRFLGRSVAFAQAWSRPRVAPASWLPAAAAPWHVLWRRWPVCAVWWAAWSSLAQGVRERGGAAV